MERIAADDVAVADLPSTSGAHWANRDNDTVYHKSGVRASTFRRPPALNSFSDDDDDGLSPSAYLPDASDVPSSSWFTDADHDTDEADPPAPQYGPAPPGSPGRSSFGVSAGPISPAADPRYEALPGSDKRPGTGFGGRDRSAGADRSARADTARALRADTVGSVRVDAGRSARADTARALRADTGGSARVDTRRSARKAAAKAARADADRPGRSDDSMPGIGQLGPGREIRPHRAARRDTGAHDHTPPRGTPQLAAPPRRSRAGKVATVVLTAIVLLAGAAAGMVYFSGSDQSLSSVLELATGGDSKDKTVTAPLDGRNTASFELVAATSKATVRTQDLGDDLYKITAGDDAGVLPNAVLSEDRVQLHLTGDGDTAGTVDVVLSSKVRWSLKFTGGADEQIVNLTGGRVAAIDVVGGSRRFELSLPKPTGTVPVRVTGAIEDFSIKSPVGSPVRVQVDSGAKTVAAGEVTLRDVKPGSTLTPKNWKVANRYDVDAAARVTLLSVVNAG